MEVWFLQRVSISVSLIYSTPHSSALKMNETLLRAGTASTAVQPSVLCYNSLSSLSCTLCLVPPGCQLFTQRWVHSLVMCMHRIPFHSHTHPHKSEDRVTPVAPEALFKPYNWQSLVQKWKKYQFTTSLSLCCANHTPSQQHLLKTR